MTAVVSVNLACDVCGEFWNMDSTPPDSTATSARRAARRDGWRRDKLGRDVCPAHPKLKGARK